MRIGSPLHVTRTSSSLNTLTPSFVKSETVPSSDVLPMLIREVGKSWNVSACLDHADSLQKGSWVTYLMLLVPPLATPTHNMDGHRIGRPALHWSCLLMQCPLAPESYVNMILGVEVASNWCTLFCLAKLTCLFLFSFFMVQLNVEPKR
jgi:hypothetical protein